MSTDSTRGRALPVIAPYTLLMETLTIFGNSPPRPPNWLLPRILTALPLRPPGMLSCRNHALERLRPSARTAPDDNMLPPGECNLVDVFGMNPASPALKQEQILLPLIHQQRTPRCRLPLAPLHLLINPRMSGKQWYNSTYCDRCTVPVISVRVLLRVLDQYAK